MANTMNHTSTSKLASTVHLINKRQNYYDSAGLCNGVNPGRRGGDCSPSLPNKNTGRRIVSFRPLKASAVLVWLHIIRHLIVTFEVSSCTKFQIFQGFAPDPTGGAYSAPTGGAYSAPTGGAYSAPTGGALYCTCSWWGRGQSPRTPPPLFGPRASALSWTDVSGWQNEVTDWQQQAVTTHTTCMTTDWQFTYHAQLR